MLSDKFLFCFAINMFYLHSNSVISGAGDILTSEHVVNIHGTRTNVADSLHQQFTVIIKDMDEESVTEAGEVENDGSGIHRRSEERVT